MKAVLISLAVLFLLGCSDPESEIYQNKSFDDIRSISKNNKIPFCIVLTDSTQNLSEEYLKLLYESYKFLSNKAVYNIIDINSPINEWYMQWLCPASIPLTCVFSAEGTMIDLIPGAAKETFLYTEEVLKTAITTDFHWPNQFKNNKKQLIPLLNNILKNREYLNNGIYIASELDMLVDSLHYPYSIYLKLVGELMNNDTLSSINTAKSLIELETPGSLDLYKMSLLQQKKS